jgi:hypothetical protein
LGELAARTHIDIASSILPWLMRNRRRFDLRTILHETSKRQSVRLGLVAPRDRQRAAQSVGVVASILSHETLSPVLGNLTKRLKHGRLVQPSMQYGLMFVAQLALMLDPPLLMRWTRRAAERHAQWAVVEMLGETVLSSGAYAARVATALLRAKDPLCIMLAACLMIDPPRRGFVPPLDESWHRLLGSGISEEDACWLCAPSVSAIGQRLREASACADQLQKNRKALGAPDPTKPMLNAEIARIEAQSATAQAHVAACERDDAVCRPIIAAMLKRSVISHEKWNLILDELPKSHGERQCLADIIGDGEARRRLLARNVSDLTAVLGGDRPDVAMSEYFTLDKAQFTDLVDGAARATTSLATDARKNIGQSTSQTMAALVAEAERTLRQPYLRLRQYSRWQSALGRYACAVAFAFAVADAVPEDRRSEVEKLVELALDHARKILKQIPEPFAPDEWWFQHLSVYTVRWLELQNRGGDIEALALDVEQPFYVRSVAFWSQAELARRYKAVALECFAKANSRWPGETADLEHATRAVLALDIAIGCSGTDEIADHLVSVWSVVCTSWKHALGSEWSGLASRLIRAVRGVEPDRSDILADNRFKHSSCRSTIEAAGKPMENAPSK